MLAEMAKTYEQKKYRQSNILYTIVAAILICTVFFGMVVSFYLNAEDEAYEMLHIQTKQIKDDLTLQLKSDKENLATMASFAAKLYATGQDYSLMFDSFKPIGLFSRIGILTSDCTFITKDETVDLSDRLSFEEEAMKGNHITGRTYSYSKPGEVVVRSAVPINVGKETVGIIYGIIKIETINEKYNNMAKELDAQLFVYDKETGKFIIDTINNPPGELLELKRRKYNDGYSYEQLINTDKGFTSFKSIRNDEDLYVHYSTMEAFNWGIILARYESQVFSETQKNEKNLVLIFLVIILIIGIYFQNQLVTGCNDKSESSNEEDEHNSKKAIYLLVCTLELFPDEYAPDCCNEWSTLTECVADRCTCLTRCDVAECCTETPDCSTKNTYEVGLEATCEILLVSYRLANERLLHYECIEHEVAEENSE